MGAQQNKNDNNHHHILGKVNKATKDLDLFMRKAPPVLTMDEMRTSSTLIDK